MNQQAMSSPGRNEVSQDFLVAYLSRHDIGRWESKKVSPSEPHESHAVPLPYRSEGTITLFVTFSVIKLF